MTRTFTVPLFIIEEHHEAFFIWSYGYFNGFIRPFGNTLLHVDSHQDMETTRLNASVDELADDLTAIYNFGYQELGIASFIIPAIYRGIINNYTHLCRYDAYCGKKLHQFVASWQSQGKYFEIGEVKPLLRRRLESEEQQWGKYQFFSYQEIGLASQFTTSQPLILDIDLDYFSCDNSLSSVQTKIEITEEAYRDFISNKYHPLRIMPVAAFSVSKEGERYYLYYTERQEEKDLKKVPPDMIHKRINNFINFLTKNNLQPGLITLCRSRFSGYTPADQWKYIEDNLLAGLANIYNLNITHINQLAPFGEVSIEKDI